MYLYIYVCIYTLFQLEDLFVELGNLLLLRPVCLNVFIYLCMYLYMSVCVFVFVFVFVYLCFTNPSCVQDGPQVPA